MTIHRRRTGLAALVMAAALILAACGTRLDHQAVVRAAGPGTLQDASGQPLADGTGSSDPLAEDGASGPNGEGVAGDAPGASPGVGTGHEGAGAKGVRGAENGRAAGPGDGGGSGGPPIVIGTVGTYSGPQGSAYAQAPRALQAWAAATNAKGGINGRKVQVIVYDDGGDGAKARSQVQDLVEQRKAAAMVASFSPTTLPAWRSYVEQKRFPVVGGSCSMFWHTSTSLFPQCAAQDMQAFGIVKLGAALNVGKKFGGLFCTEASDCTHLEDLYFNKGMAKKAGLEPVYRARVSITQPDFTSECIQARNAGVELFTVIADPNTLSRVAASCRRQNFTPQFISGGFLVDVNTPKQPGLSNVAIMMPTFPFEGLSTPIYKEFSSVWKKYGGGAAPGPTASYAWAAAKLFEKAARAAGDDVSTSAGIVKGLYTIKNDRLGGLTVPISFVPGKPAADAGCWFVMRAVDGRWTAPQGDRLSCK